MALTEILIEVPYPIASRTAPHAKEAVLVFKQKAAKDALVLPAGSMVWQQGECSSAAGREMARIEGEGGGWADAGARRKKLMGAAAAGQRWYSAAHKSNANRILVLIK